ncbi:hypothetical protein C4J81_18450 [Deltaproteobacteria bacterium Smac51]|nr:hypothetical protein C4J81_18450 [Deltaproteobacteria bacterium Smac51]
MPRLGTNQEDEVRKLICMLTMVMILAVMSAGPALAAGAFSLGSAGKINGSVSLITEDSFELSKAEKAFFTKAKAEVPGENGIFTNTQGVSAYLLTEEAPLSFHWTGADQKALVFDGSSRRMINGTGELAVKYADDNLVLQRYKGSVQNGLWHGRGELLAREAYHYNAFYYAGDFVHGRMEGHGVYINNDLLDRGGVPFVYEGEFMDDTFHGQGVMTDLNTGEVIHAGLWLEGFPFEGSLDSWKRENKKVELLYAQRRYNDPRIMSQVELAGHQGSSSKTERTAKGEITSLETAKSAGAGSK